MRCIHDGRGNFAGCVPHGRASRRLVPVLTSQESGDELMTTDRTKKWTAADVGGFRGWLVDQIRRQDAVGDLAREIRADTCLGQKRTPKAILSHMVADHEPCGDAMEAFKRAVAEWITGRATNRHSRLTVSPELAKGITELVGPAPARDYSEEPF